MITSVANGIKSNASRLASVDNSNDRFSLGHVAVGVASVMLGGTATDAIAQSSELPTIQVESSGESPDNTLQADTGVARLGRVQDIPQTVTVINKQTLQQQGVTTLEQALRNVPGVTVAIGEGGGGLNGDQFRIRGFQAKGDIYVDGLRDFGVYVRDSFAYEQIQVLKGPSSESFGVGTTGGAINSVLKNAKLGNFMDIQGTIGLGPMYRSVVDVNRQLDATTAVRVVAMGHKQDLVERDHLFSDRWGVLGSVGFGLGTGTSLTLSYLHQDGDRKPDMGQPIATLPGQISRPVGEFGVRRANFYGKETDIDNTQVNMFTARFKHDVNNWVTITNDTRVAHYDRHFVQSVATCGVDDACAASVVSGNLNVPYKLGGPAGYNQTSWGLQNLTTAVAKFNAGSLRHELIAGFDISTQNNERQGMTPVVRNVGTIANPIYRSDYTVTLNPLDRRTSDAVNVALFASDRVWLNEQFSLLGGARLDRYISTYGNTDMATGAWKGTVSNAELLASPKASAIWEPTKTQTYYVTWARSYSNLAGQFVANDLNVISNPTLKPEQNDLWEVGTKINLLDGKLGLTGALFQVTKGNSIQTDAESGSVVQTNETQRVRGVELGLTGKVTDQWTVQLAYAYMDSKIIDAPPPVETVPPALPAPNVVGNRVAFVPQNAASVWTTYDVAPMLRIPGALLVGGGVFYTDEYFANSANLALIPSSWVVNGLISYEVKNYRVALNVYNLTNELYYEAAMGNRAVVAAGRTVTLTAGVKW